MPARAPADASMTTDRPLLEGPAASAGDVADARARERRLFERIVQENVGEVVVRFRLTEPRGFEYVSDAVEAVTGFTPAECYADPDLVAARLAEEDRPKFDAAVAAPDLARGPVVFAWRRKDGRTVALEWRGTVVVEGGRPVAVEGVVRDVGDEHAHAVVRAAEDQAKELARLKELDLLKTRLIHTAAQEFGTPLTPVKVQVHLLLTKWSVNLNEQQVRALETIARNVDRLEQLVKDVSDVARLHTGRLPTLRRRVDLSRIAAETVASFEDVASKAGVTLERRVEPGLEVDGDVGRLTQALFNLVGNAVKFTPRGGRVALHARRVGDLVVASVHDTGIGIRVEDVSRLFQPFVQLDEAVKLGRPGTGVGLFIARGIVEGHGGRIWAESEGAGKGSAFTFTLPAAEPVKPA